MLHLESMVETLKWLPSLDKHLSNARLLVVDDEPNIRTAIAQALRLTGYSVDEASSGLEALALLGQQTYDLMVVDMKMPGLDGIEVMDRARQLQPELLIIVLTGYASLESAIAAVKLDAVDYLRKPLRAQEIVDAVTQTLQKHADRLRRHHLVEVLGEALTTLSRTDSSAEPSPSEEPASASHPNSKQFICVPPLILDQHKRLVMKQDNSANPVELTKGETAVLAELMTYPDQPLSCQELVYSAWGEIVNAEEAENIIRPHIFRLRRKVEITPKTPHIICTVRRRGYCFVSSS